MKKIETLSKIFLASLLVAGSTVACKDKTPAPVIPELSNEIQLPARIGGGQKVTATYTLPEENPQNVNWSDYTWVTPAQPTAAEPAVIGEDKKTNITFIVPKTLGKSKISFIAKHSAQDGSGSIIKEKKAEFDIVACDVINSFWGDSKDEVAKTSPVKLTVKGTELIGEIEPIQRQPAVTAIRKYSFDDKSNQLVMVTETETGVYNKNSFVNDFLIVAGYITEDPTMKKYTIQTINKSTGAIVMSYKDEDFPAAIEAITNDVLAQKVVFSFRAELAKNIITMNLQATPASIATIERQYRPNK